MLRRRRTGTDPASTDRSRWQVLAALAATGRLIIEATRLGWEWLKGGGPGEPLT